MELVVGLLVGTFGILLTWLGLMIIFIGVGLNIQSMFGVTRVNVDRLLIAFWMGFAAVIAFLQLWHLAFAVTWRSLAVVFALGLTGLWRNAASIRGYLFELKSRNLRLVFAILLVAGAWVANRAAGPPGQYDSGMYHISGVRWAKTYPIVPGLGNLHDRLGFNNSSLLYTAMLDVGPWSGRSSHLSSGLILLMLLLQIILSAFRLKRSTVPPRASDFFDLFLLAPVVAMVIRPDSIRSPDISSPSTDIAVAVVIFVAASKLYARLMAPGLDGKEDAYDLVAVITLLALGPCLKMSSAFFSVTAILLGFWLVRKRGSRWTTRTLRYGIGFILLLGVPWMMRSVILTGYPFYPSSIGGLPVEWRLPTELADAERAWISVDARGSTLQGWSWVPVWWKANRSWPLRHPFLLGVVLPGALAATASCIQFLSRHKNRNIQQEGKACWRLLAPTITGIPFWLVLAPDTRFGFYLLWILAATTASQAVLTYGPAMSRIRRTAVLLACVGMGSLPMVIAPLHALRVGYAVGATKALIHNLVVLPGPDHGLYPTPIATLQRFNTRSGLTLYFPTQDNRCWDAPLPCTPHPAPNLVLKQEPDGRPRFLTDGTWQQVNWPNAKSQFREFWRRQQASSVK